MKFRTIASGSGGNCYVVTSEKAKPLILEAGIPLAKLQEKTGFTARKCAGVLVTHGHMDHAKGIPAIHCSGINVYASAETWAKFEQKRPHRCFTVKPGAAFRLDAWKILPFAAIHDAEGTLGYLIQAPDGDQLLFLTDSAYSPHTFEGLTHIAIEANYCPDILNESVANGLNQARYIRTVENHMSIKTVLDFLKAHDLTKCREIHLLHLSAGHADPESFRSQVEQATGIPTFTAPTKTSEIIQL